jgi:hypothetical protein
VSTRGVVKVVQSCMVLEAFHHSVMVCLKVGQCRRRPPLVAASSLFLIRMHMYVYVRVKLI